MKKSIIFMLGLTTILTLTSCNGLSITPDQAKQKFEKMGETVKQDKDLKELSTKTLVRLEGEEEGKTEVIEIEAKNDISLTEGYMHSYGRLNTDILDDAYMYQKDGAYYTYDGVNKVKTTLEISQDEYLKQVNTNWASTLTTVIETASETFESTIGLTKEYITTSLKEELGENIELTFPKFDTELRSKDDTHLYAEYNILAKGKASEESKIIEFSQEYHFSLLMEDSLISHLLLSVKVNQTTTEGKVIKTAYNNIITDISVSRKANIIYPIA